MAFALKKISVSSIAPSRTRESLTARSSAQTPVTVFVGATVIDGSGAAPVENAVLLVRDGRVAALGRTSVVIPPGANRIDLRRKTVLPGFVNAHAHVDDPMGTRANLERQLLLYGVYGITSVFSPGEHGVRVTSSTWSWS